jgi:hypothetical protein
MVVLDGTAALAVAVSLTATFSVAVELAAAAAPEEDGTGWATVGLGGVMEAVVGVLDAVVDVAELPGGALAPDMGAAATAAAGNGQRWP